MDMRRGTPSAKLFGHLLSLVRSLGTRGSMRQVGESIGAPAATVSQVEKGQRALKAPKIALWAAALEVSEADLHELWVLCQGLVPVGRDQPVFYSDRPDALGSDLLDADIIETLQDRPDLEAIYRLAVRITAVLRRLLPDASIRVEPDEFDPSYTPHMDEAGAWVISPDAQMKLEADFAAFVPLPGIWIYWGDTQARGRKLEFDSREGVRMPLLQIPTPIVRRRGKSVNTVELEDLIRELSGPERERVRGYVEAIVEQRATPDD
ncbi:XRE family transcriptional regulator [Cryobacterium sp. Hh7]|uniref:helix-turn-helix domain-containing protein n=1 Tax=Cryobacterium sp. Hh7 TaxID=1259159 RepID=UPI001068DA28|nr:helix-turn-helix transcriptional regulator [Cryobacterium sp. Hh7]TFD55068.1 XRE family transcriptional regulator [Cryobacterium sp. Hh7]